MCEVLWLKSLMKKNDFIQISFTSDWIPAFGLPMGIGCEKLFMNWAKNMRVLIVISSSQETQMSICLFNSWLFRVICYIQTMWYLALEVCSWFSYYVFHFVNSKYVF